MAFVGSILLVHVFTAVLPPLDPNERDYYDCLGLERSASEEAIRKNYKAKSLLFHPDKVAQRGDENAADAAAEYEQVQEAYAVLSDRHKRQQYHALGCSPHRYRFVHTGGLHNPMALHENLQQASFADKTRLVAVVAVLLCLFLLQPILIAAKVNANVTQSGSLQDTSWSVILVPLWIFYGLFIVFWIVAAALTKEGRDQLFAIVCEHVCWITGIGLLASKWDGNRAGTSWHVISTPFYLGIMFRLYVVQRSLYILREERAKMASPEFVHEQEGNLEDASDEKLAEVAEKYSVVTVDPEAVAVAVAILQEADHEVTDDDLEAIKVQSSPEFAETEHAIRNLTGNTISLVVIWITFIALTASKLQNQISASWWVVFLPIWLYLGFKLLGAFSSCLGALALMAQIEEQHIVVAGSSGDVADEEASQANGDVEVKRPKASANFANAEGDIEAFNKSSLKSQPSDEHMMGRPSSPAPSDEDGDVRVVTKGGTEEVEIKVPSEGMGEESEPNIVESPSVLDKIDDWLTPKPDAQFTQAPPDPPASTEVEGEEAMEEVEIEAPKADEQHVEGTGDDDEEEGIEIDEESYHAWQSAHAEAEHRAKEKIARANTTCCFVCFQFLVLLLLVGKLQTDYRNPDPSDNGYNAFWIMFPAFLVTGLILLCCICLIYGAGTSINQDDTAEQGKEHADAAAEEPQRASQPSPTQDSTDALDHSNFSNPTDEELSPDVEIGEDINDLD